MKKTICILLAAALSLGLAGCAAGLPPEKAVDGSS